jgi:hypothetical protein
MRKIIFSFVLLVGASSFASCSADKRHADVPLPPVSPADIVSITSQLLHFASAETKPSSLVHAVTGAPPDVDPSREHWGYHHGAFQSMDGYLVTDLEVRVRSGGFDAASFILLHVDDDPCLSLESLARSMGAADKVYFPPSPHAPNGTSAQGYALNTRAGGRLVISSRGKPWNCVTLVTASGN